MAGLALSKRPEYDELAAGGVVGPGLPRRCKRHDDRACAVCAEAANHGTDSPRGPTWSQAIRRAQGKVKGQRYRTSWIEKYSKASASEKAFMKGGP